MIRNKKVLMADRKAQIEEWSEKGAKWCASKLYEARADNREFLNRISEDFDDRVKDILQGKNNTLKEVNDNLKTVLEENGIRPTKLRVYYQSFDCQNCSKGERYEGRWICGNEDPWWEDNCPVRNHVDSISFYTYAIDNGYIEGITSKFKRIRIDAIKIVDERTGEVLCNYMGDEQNDDQE